MNTKITAEKCLTTVFHRSIYSKFSKAVSDYELIQSGDSICVCISGGKDSALLAKLMQHYVKYSCTDVRLEFLILDPGFDVDIEKHISDNMKALCIPIHIERTKIFGAAGKSDKNPCFTCARIRRKQLYEYAGKLQCNKIALGHHFDDVIETILMGMLYGGQMQSMLPKRKSDHYSNMELIRPMYYIRERDIEEWVSLCGLQFEKCSCPAAETKEKSSKRAEIKELIARLREINPQMDNNIFRSAENVNLKNLMSYKDETGVHSFLDNY